MDSIIDEALINSDIETLCSLISSNFSRKINNEIVTSKEFFKKSLIEFFNNYQILESKTTTLNILENEIDNTILCLGKNEETILNLKNGEQIKRAGEWAQIRMQNSEGIWKIKNVIGTSYKI